MQLTECADCGCAVYCSEDCLQLAAEGHSSMCSKLQAAKNVSDASKLEAAAPKPAACQSSLNRVSTWGMLHN
jgi:hypothetical protein